MIPVVCLGDSIGTIGIGGRGVIPICRSLSAVAVAILTLMGVTRTHLTNLLGTVPLLHPNCIFGLSQELLHMLKLFLVREESLEACGLGIAIQGLRPGQNMLRLIEEMLHSTHD
jgi:hypothetical protein